jgi:hypothetical protein
MENPNTQRRAIGLLVVFATILAVVGIWNFPETEGGQPLRRALKNAS